MNALDSGSSTERTIVSAQTHPDGCFLFSPVRDDAGKVIDFRCVGLDAAAQSLLAALGAASSLHGRGGNGLLDLAACIEVFQTGQAHDRELRAGSEAAHRSYAAVMTREGEGLALRLRAVGPGNRPADPGAAALELGAIPAAESDSRPGPAASAADSAQLPAAESEAPSRPRSSAADSEQLPAADAGPAVWEWNPRAHAGSWSPGAETLFGVPRGALDPTPESLVARVHSRERDEVGATLGRALERGGSFALAYRVPGPDGRLRHHELRGRVELEGPGGPRLVAVLTEVREVATGASTPPARSGADRDWLHGQATREVVRDWSPSDGTIVWSDTLGSVLGWSSGPRYDHAWWESTLHPEDRQRVLASLRRAKDSGAEVWREEYRFQRGDGGWAAILDRGYLVRDAEGRLIRLVSCMADLTEFKAAEAAREEARALQDGFRERFIGILGHDLRTPLNAISLSAQTLRRRTQLTDAQRDVVGRIQSSAARMERMITEILDLTRARLAGGIPVRPTRCDVHALCRRVLQELQAGHPDRPLHLRIHGESAAAVDAERLEQAVANIVSNACQHSPAGLPVSVESRMDSARWTLTVHNGGPPIAPERLGDLFEPFRNAAAQHGARAGSGLGLGLFIVREIAQAHGGSVQVESSEANGTVFSLSLPRRGEQAPTP